MAKNKGLILYKMKDKSDSFTITKSVVFSLPMRLIICGRTGCGKSAKLGNLLLRDDMYRKDFKPENIFIFSGSLHGDFKLATIIKELDIPDSNLFDDFDEQIGNVLYDQIVEDYNESLENKIKPEHSLFIFDDLSFTNRMNKSKKDSILDRLMCNGRKFLISTILLNQKMTQLSTCSREQCSGLMLHKSSNKQLEIVESDFNFLPSKKIFLNMVKKHTENQHDAIIFDLQKSQIYRNQHFQPICLCSEGKNDCGGYK